VQTVKLSHESIATAVRKIVDGLPHREAIVEGDARHWIQEVVARYGDLAPWHAIRAGGFGGSQIGALVRNFVGSRADHEQSAHDIVAGALLRVVPDEPNGPMRRGIAMEDQHRGWFLQKYGAVRDEVGFATLSKSIGMRAWMRYSPDELAFMTLQDGRQQARVLADYKAPGKVDDASEVSFQYGCQLHLGRLVCTHNAIQVDAMMLSQFDWANWQLKDNEVEYVPELDELIIQAGDHYWDFVLRGQVPPYVRKQPLGAADAVRAQVSEPARRLARLKAIVKVLETKIETIEAQVKPALQDLRFGQARLQLDGIAYSAVPKYDAAVVRTKLSAEQLATVALARSNSKRYDEDAMLARLRSLDQDPREFVQPSSLDPHALYELLAEAGLDADAMVGETLRGALDKKLVVQMNGWVEREFAHLLEPAAVGPVDEVSEVDGAADERDDEGQEASRSVPRSVMA
jgi:hypothetical protein